MTKITTRGEAAQDAFEKVRAGTHVVVPFDLLRTLALAGLRAYAPAWGGDETAAVDAGRAAQNILIRHAGLGDVET